MGEFTVTGLRVVREAARHGSFSTTAERLGYTQSAVSRQIALMEQAAGKPLFERHARGVRPTEAGRLVAQHADTVLAELDAAHTNLQNLSHPPGRVRIGAFSTAMAALVPRAVAALRRYNPDTHLRLREGTTPRLLNAIAKGRLDLAVVTTPPSTDVTLTPLLDDPLFVAVGPEHPLAHHTSATPAMLQDHPWIAGSTEPATTLLGAWDTSWNPRIAFVARDWVAKLGLVSAGLGITTVPGLAVPALPPAIAVVRIDHPAAVRATALAHHPSAQDNPHLQALTEALRDTAADISAELRRTLRPPPIRRARGE